MKSCLYTRENHPTVVGRVSLFLQPFFIFLIKCYRLFLSPLFGQSCRFYPSCSHYSEQAILQYGIVKGLCLTLLRLSRCHPWHPGGIDPVPPVEDKCCNN